MLFYLGTHETHWLGRTDVPLFISARRLRGRKNHHRALGQWALDSGGFSELSIHGKWITPPEQYADEVYGYQEKIGNLQWAAQQDWMCEPVMVEKTGLSVEEHQSRTIENYLALRRIAPEIPWIPVLQGFRHDDYIRHVGEWEKVGVNLPLLPLVGLAAFAAGRTLAWRKNSSGSCAAWGSDCTCSASN